MYFQPTLEKFILLAAFMPAVMATGGSVGIQTSAIVIRALGTGTINVAQTFKVILSELKLSSILGVICGLVAGLTGYFLTGTKQAGIDFFKVIFLSLSAASLMSAFFGASFPLLLEKIKSDLTKKDNEKKQNAKKIAEQINQKEYIVKKLSTENNELYGSVKPTDISKIILNSNKIEIKPSMIQPVKEIRSLGKFEVKISLHSEVDAKIFIKVDSAETIQ